MSPDGEGEPQGQEAEPGRTRDAETKAIIAAAFDNSADSYEQVGVDFFALFGRELARRAAPRPGERVLDLGTGRGHCLFPVAAAVGTGGRVIGTDLSTRMVHLCAAQARAEGLEQVTVQAGDAAAPDFPAGSFDLITAGMVMFFVPEPRKVMRRVAGLLRPGGRYAMSTFGPSDPKFEQTMLTLYRHRVGPEWEPATDKPFDTPDSITEMLVEAGFLDVAVDDLVHDISFETLDGYWAWVGSHGGRIMIDEVGPDRMPQARAEIDAMLQPLRDDRGILTIRSVARFTTARVPM